MRFDYVPLDGNWLPLIPISFQHGNRRLPSVRALVDTGATQTILPMEMATPLGIHLDVEDRVQAQVAGGGECFIYPSPVQVSYVLGDPNSDTEYRWKGLVFFALGQQFLLLGHHQCLERFDVTFKGPEKFLEIIPRFARDT